MSIEILNKTNLSFVWENRNSSYTAKHHWMEYHFGKPMECEECKLKGLPKGMKQYFDWANLSGEYKYERTDWKRLCRMCHSKMDTHLGSQGENHRMAKLKNSDIPLIRELLGKSQIKAKRIAQIFNISLTTIYRIKNGKMWKHIL